MYFIWYIQLYMLYKKISIIHFNLYIYDLSIIDFIRNYFWMKMKTIVFKGDKISEFINNIGKFGEIIEIKVTCSTKDYTFDEPPKKNVNAYEHFINEKSEQIIAENPTITAYGLYASISDMWAKLTTDEERIYKHLADNDKIRYDRELAEYSKRN